MSRRATTFKSQIWLQACVTLPKRIALLISPTQWGNSEHGSTALDTGGLTWTRSAHYRYTRNISGMKLRGRRMLLSSGRLNKSWGVHIRKHGKGVSVCIYCTVMTVSLALSLSFSFPLSHALSRSFAISLCALFFLCVCTHACVCFCLCVCVYFHRYDRNKLVLKEVHNVQYVSCMNPTAGSFTINPRLQVHSHSHTRPHTCIHTYTHVYKYASCNTMIKCTLIFL